jgi:hypothetical protein
MEVSGARIKRVTFSLIPLAHPGPTVLHHSSCCVPGLNRELQEQEHMTSPQTNGRRNLKQFINLNMRIQCLLVEAGVYNAFLCCRRYDLRVVKREQNRAEDSKILENKPKLKPYHPHWLCFSAIENVAFRPLAL